LIYSKTGIHLTEDFERCRLTAYPDQGGVMTIGWGHTRGVIAGLTCTQQQADLWLWEDLGFSSAAVNKLVTVALSQDEFDALVDFVFNVGVGNFEHSTLLRLLNSGEIQQAALEFDKWDHVKGRVVQGLLRRREMETQEFEGAD
jgi:lysozyme